MAIAQYPMWVYDGAGPPLLVQAPQQLAALPVAYQANAVNPISYIDTGTPQQFSIQADISGAGGALLTIAPPIITSGSLQTVSASPANNALVTFLMATGSVGATMAAQSSRNSYVFHPEAFAFVMAELPDNLAGANAKRMSDPDAKVTMRWAEQYNIQTDQEPSRVDMLVGVATVLPYMALRVWT